MRFTLYAGVRGLLCELGNSFPNECEIKGHALLHIDGLNKDKCII